MSYLITELVPEIRDTVVNLKRWAEKDYSKIRKPVLFPQLNLGFVPIPRNGSGSLFQFFGARSGLCAPNVGEAQLRRIPIPRLKMLQGGTLVFSMVRNPWSRLFSVYTSHCLKPANRTPVSEDVGLDLPPWMNRRFYFEMPFDRFITEVCRIPDAFADPALCSQSRFLLNKQGTLIPQFIGRVERMNEDVNRLCRILEIPPGAPRKLFASQPDACYGEETGNYRDVYTPRLYAKVARRYSTDIGLFGYRPDGIPPIVVH